MLYQISGSISDFPSTLKLKPNQNYVLPCVAKTKIKTNPSLMLSLIDQREKDTQKKINKR